MIMKALQGHPHRHLHRYLQARAEAHEQQRPSRDSAMPAQTAGPETAGPVTATTSASAAGRLRRHAATGQTPPPEPGQMGGQRRSRKRSAVHPPRCRMIGFRARR